MMFGVVFRVIGSKLEENWFLGVFGQKAWTNPSGFWLRLDACPLDYLFKIWCRESPVCLRGFHTETVKRYLLDCPLYS